MDALLRIRTRDGGEVLNNKVDAIVSNGKKQSKGAKAPKAQKSVKVPKAPKSVKVPKGVSSTNKNGEFAKFTPIKAATRENHKSVIKMLNDYQGRNKTAEAIHVLQHTPAFPDKEMSVYGTVTFSGTISIPLSEIEDFDLSNVTIEAEVSSYEYDADLTVDDVSLEEN